MPFGVTTNPLRLRSSEPTSAAAYTGAVRTDMNIPATPDDPTDS